MTDLLTVRGNPARKGWLLGLAVTAVQPRVRRRPGSHRSVA